jgi:hypothetical protein
MTLMLAVLMGAVVHVAEEHNRRSPMSTETTVASATSQKRIDANRRNAQRSTGPRTPEGKARSRFNGLKNGLTASVPVLPGEDPAEYHARVEAVVASLTPQNQVEYDLLERVAATAWSLERARRAEAARLSYLIRHDAIERQRREEEEAIELGQGLLWDARGPWQVYPHHPTTGLGWEKCTSWSENPSDPHNPALLVHRLERTIAGCRWLLNRWAELLARLEPGEVWTASDQFKSVRLLGKQPLDAIDDPEVAQIFLASATLLPDRNDAEALALIKSEIRKSGFDDKDDHSIYSRALKSRQLAKLRPRDAKAARAVLRDLVERHTSRLKLVLARNQEIAEADNAEALARLAFDHSHEGEKLRRYALSAARLVNQTVNAFIKIRKDVSVVSCPDESSVVRCPDELSVVRCPLSVDPEEAQSIADPPEMVGSGAPGAAESSGAELSVVSCPLSGAREMAQDIADSRNVSRAADPARAAAGRRALAEAGTAADELSNNGPRTTDHGQVRTEANTAADELSNNGPRTTDHGQVRTEANTGADESSNNGPRTTDHGQNADSSLETMSIVEPQESIQVTANSGALSGLDNGATQPGEDSTPEQGKPPRSPFESGKPTPQMSDSSDRTCSERVPMAVSEQKKRRLRRAEEEDRRAVERMVEEKLKAGTCSLREILTSAMTLPLAGGRGP